MKKLIVLIGVITVASPSILNAEVVTVSPAEGEVFQTLSDAQQKVLNGALGVGKEDLERDWESTFYNEGDILGVEDPKHARGTQHFDAGFSKYGQPGDTLQRRIELYLLDCGVTDEEIARFRSIMTEPSCKKQSIK